MKFNKQLIFIILLVTAFSVNALNVSNHYSPENIRTQKRKFTKFIILHTTEGSKKGSLQKLYDDGAAHYLVYPNGHIFRIIDKNKVAMHAGLSMWNGLEKLNLYSIAIEAVGYHNFDITKKQYQAIRELIAQLKEWYNIPDINIIPHAMIAYGSANQWHKKPHRGRKRCGMLFALSSVREKLGLKEQPSFDPDIKAKRLIQGDYDLANVLFGDENQQKAAFVKLHNTNLQIISKGISAWDIARELYNHSNTIYIFPNGNQYSGKEINDWKKIPEGTKVRIPQIKN